MWIGQLSSNEWKNTVATIGCKIYWKFGRFHEKLYFEEKF